MTTKNTLGIVGGMGSHASTWLMQRIIALSDVDKDQDYLEILLHNNTSIPDRTQSILNGGESPVEQIRRSLRLMETYGVDMVVMACMTAYYFYDNVRDSFSGHFIHPVDIVIEELRENAMLYGKYRVGLMGTTGTIQSRIFHDKLSPLGYHVVSLDRNDQECLFMDPVYGKNGFKAGVFDKENIKKFHRQIDAFRAKGVDIVVGACSEIPLVMSQRSVDMPFIDAFELLALKIVSNCYINEPRDVVQA